MKRKSFLGYYNTYFEKIYRYMFFRTGRKMALAEDLTSEVMLKAYENFKDFDQKRSFSVWIYRVAHNHLVDYYKKMKAKQIPLEEVEDQLGTDEKLNKMLNDKINIGKIDNVLDNMPAQQKDIIVMKFMNELSNKEIADVLKMTEAHVRVLQHRALSFLRSRLSFLNT